MQTNSQCECCPHIGHAPTDFHKFSTGHQRLTFYIETLCRLQVIVQGLPFAYAWQDLKDLFKPIGGVLQADIVMGQDGRSRGWGTVSFETQADAEKAIKVIYTAFLLGIVQPPTSLALQFVLLLCDAKMLTPILPKSMMKLLQ